MLHLINLIQRDECADRHVGELLITEELAEKLQQTANGLVIALCACRSGPERTRDPQQEIDVTRQHRVHLDEFLGR